MCIYFVSIRRVIFHIEDASISGVQNCTFTPNHKAGQEQPNLGSPCFVNRPYLLLATGRRQKCMAVGNTRKLCDEMESRLG